MLNFERNRKSGERFLSNKDDESENSSVAAGSAAAAAAVAGPGFEPVGMERRDTQARQVLSLVVANGERTK